MESLEPFNLLWEDKEIKFDTANVQKHLRNGEHVISTIYHIEDSKGNPGDSGRLLATNLRLIWYSLVHKKFNLSIGYGRIANMNTKITNNKVRGNCLALYILAIGGNTRFEFLFTDVSGETERKNTPIFQSIFDIYHLYQRTYLYRDLKLRGAILQSGQLIILPQEQVINKVNGVWNLSSDQGNLGCFVVTNIRVVWYADSNDTFNISLPYMQIANIRIRESKYGPALVVQTAETGGGYVLGFRIDPIERLTEIYKELISLHTVYTENPNFGIVYDQYKRKTNKDFNYRKDFKVEEFQEIDERQEREINSKLNTYLAEGSLMVGEEKPPREPVYCKELGFAMERIRDGYKLKDLWDVLPQQMVMIEEE
ncbi:Bardet-Biedl syndrome 5 protein [Haematobia irritans]|uniref:Bardet-Biedl syndrome 5 protein n=1 Tax=Haematobia irritans TaxID=7368 RepID=UPI003F500668